MDQKPETIASNAEASAVWDTLQEQLHTRGKWRPEYVSMFAVLVDAIVGFYDTCVTLANPDCLPILISRKGQPYRNPLLDIKAAHIGVIHRYGSAFGLSPLSDAKLKAVPLEGLPELLKLMLGEPDQAAAKT